MMNMKNMNVTVEQMVEMINANEITFSNIVQRGLTWDASKKALLIHSIVTGFPIPMFFARSIEGEMDMLDGKQRGTTLKAFLNDEFALATIPEIDFVNKEREVEVMDISGMKYSELPEDIKKRINRYTLIISYDENITDDEASEMFYRLNNGKPLTASEKAWANTKSKYEIDELCNLPIFSVAHCMTEKGIEEKKQRDHVKKMFSILNMNRAYDTKLNKWIDVNDITKDSEIEVSYGEVNWDPKPIAEWLSVATLDEETANKITEICSFITDIHEFLLEEMEDTKEMKHRKAVANKIYSKTHLLAVFHLINEIMKEDIDTSTGEICEFLSKFYIISTRKGCTTSAKYNEKAKGGTGHAGSIKERHDEITKAFMKFYKKNKKNSADSTTETPVVDTPVETPVATEPETVTENTTEDVDATTDEVVTDTETTEIEIDPIDNLDDEPVDEGFEKVFGNYDGYEIDDEELDVDFDE